MPKINLPEFPPLDSKHYPSDEAISAELKRRRALIDAAWPDDLEVSDEELHELGYAVDKTGDNKGLNVILGRG